MLAALGPMATPSRAAAPPASVALMGPATLALFDLLATQQARPGCRAANAQLLQAMGLAARSPSFQALSAMGDDPNVRQWAEDFARRCTADADAHPSACASLFAALQGAHARWLASDVWARDVASPAHLALQAAARARLAGRCSWPDEALLPSVWATLLPLQVAGAGPVCAAIEADVDAQARTLLQSRAVRQLGAEPTYRTLTRASSTLLSTCGTGGANVSLHLSPGCQGLVAQVLWRSRDVVQTPAWLAVQGAPDFAGWVRGLQIWLDHGCARF